jgi:hypothetical protein
MPDTHFVDRKPDGYGFARETHDTTEGKVFARYGAPEQAVSHRRRNPFHLRTKSTERPERQQGDLQELPSSRWNQSATGLPNDT